jgi:uncharacterized delta-60 repeat protein
MRTVVLFLALGLGGCGASGSSSPSAPSPPSGTPSDLAVPANDGGITTPSGDMALSPRDLAGVAGPAPAGAQKWCTPPFAYKNDPKTNSAPSDLVADGSGHVFVVGATSPSTTSGYGWFVRIDDGKVAANTMGSMSNSAYHVALSPGGAPTLTPPLTRMSLDGTPDPTFHSDASVALWAWLRYQSTGKVIVASALQSELGRVGSDGTLDSGFGNQGLVKLTSPSTIISILVDTHDRIYVVGWASGPSWVVTRYGVDGALDTTFGAGGTVTVPAPPTNRNIMYATINGDDVYFGGNYYAAAGDAGEWIYHVNADGLVDSYGVGGHVKVIGLPGYANAVAVQSDGALLITGENSEVWYLARVTAKGAVDTAYGQNGWVSGTAQVGGPSPTPVTTYPPMAVAVTPDGTGLLLQKKEYVQNLYSETSAIVCAYTP